MNMLLEILAYTGFWFLLIALIVFTIYARRKR